MTYTLLIGQRLYSSWSLRGWLCFDPFGIPCDVKTVEIYSDEFSEVVRRFAGGRSVPAALTPDGGQLTDTLAIAWHLTEAFPDKGLLPTDPIERALAQSMISEMHSGFGALRSACPMNLGTGWAGFVPDELVRRDLERIEVLWSRALDKSGGPFLFGNFTLADAFFAPVSARIAGFGLPVSAAAKGIAAEHLDHPSFRHWREAALGEGKLLTVYDQPLDRVPFPGLSDLLA